MGYARRSLGLPAALLLLLAAALVLASCGGEQAGGGQEEGESGSGGEMSGMDHGGTESGSGGMASEMLREDGEYSDELFIDMMAPHHQGAVEMAQVALGNAEHEEIRSLAQNIVSDQEAEIEELREIKGEEFGDTEVPTRMSPEEMRMMGMTENPEDLADQEPFDKAFMDAMTPHHESAIDMARVANEESDDPRVRDLSGRIVEAQEREIGQMSAWREEWYPNE